jgi:hypothetical protein
MSDIDNDNDYGRESFGSDAYSPDDVMMGRNSFSSDDRNFSNVIMDNNMPVDIIDRINDFEERLKRVENKIGIVSGGNRKHKSRRIRNSKKSKRSRRSRKSKKNRKNTRAKGKEWKMTPITDKKELQRLEEYEQRAAERERNDAEINQINAELDRQRNNVLSGLIGTPMDPKDIERQKRKDEMHNRRVNSEKAKERKLTIYDL